jgi:septal ring factor EnvC (AmiA/AmiB activator)
MRGPLKPATPSLVRAAILTLAVTTLAATGWALAAPALSGAQSENQLRSRADRARAHEHALASGVARLGRLIARLDGDIAVIERRRAEVQAQLDSDVQQLATIRGELRGQRRRVVRLRARYAEARIVLSQRMVELYRAPQPDIVTVVMKARGFADLLEQATYVRFVGAQDRQIIRIVRRARVDAAGAVRSLARDERRQAGVTAAVQTRRDALVGISASLAARRATLGQARAARAAALQATRADRQNLERRIAALEAARVRAARAAGPGGPWVIPWPIVQCESGGQNLPPNGAGASGYYQIIPGTWSLYGGSGRHAFQASKAEQDRVAARIWNGGSGASQWVCAALVA